MGAFIRPSGPNPCALQGLGSDSKAEVRRATSMLEPWIEHVRAQYVNAGLDKVKRTKVIVTPDARDDGRHFAYCRTDGGLIGLAPEMIGLPAATCLGIIAHEFGHAADYLYPGAFCVTSSGKVLGALAGPTSKQVVPNARYRHWLERNYDAVERTADKVAETVLGVRIGYAGPCMLETVNAGKRPRPKGLR